MRIGTFVILLLILSKTLSAQSYLEPIVGFQAGVGKTRLQQLNTAVQYSHAMTDEYEIIWRLQQSWPLTTGYNDSAFTQNSSLPVYQNAKRMIRPNTLSVALGHRFRLFDITPDNRISLLLFTGLKYEKIKVSYAYDKANYTILNPDLTRSKFGAYFSLGFEYMHTLKKGRIFTQFAFATPPVGKKSRNPPGLNFMVPLTFNVGYSITVKNRKNAKK